MTLFLPREAAPAQNAIEPRLSAALDWIGRAKSASGNGGISKGYHAIRRRWSPSYPETTGYTIPTLLNDAVELLDAGAAYDARMAMAGRARELSGQFAMPLVFLRVTAAGPRLRPRHPRPQPTICNTPHR